MVNEDRNKDPQSFNKTIILIGGVPGVGKSSISGYLAHKLNYDIVLSGDYLREFIRPYLGEEYKIAMSSVYDSWQYFGEKTHDNIVKGFLKQTEIMNRGIEKVFERADQNGEKIILETLYFYPDFIKKLSNIVLPVYLYIQDAEEHKKHLEERSNFTHPRSHGSRLSAHLFEYRIMMQKSIEFSNEHNIKTFDMTDYLGSRDKILEYIRGEV